MGKRDGRLSDCGQCLRYLLITGNVLFWMISCAIIGVGVWIIVDRNFMAAIYGNILMTVSAYLVVVAGGAMFLITGCGCIGAIAQNRTLLLIYFITLIGICLFLIVGAILAIVYRIEIKRELQYEVMRETIKKNYGVDTSTNYYNQLITQAWDKTQSELRCCAVEDNHWEVYRASEWYQLQEGTDQIDKPYVPPSCCKQDQYGNYLNLDKCQTWNQGPPAITGGKLNEALFYRGCYEAGKDFIMDYSAALIGMGIGFAVFMMVGIFMSFMLFRMVDY